MQEAIERIRSIDYDLIFNQAIEEKKNLILDLIRSQLSKGNRVDGSAIGEHTMGVISEKYVELKRSLNLFAGGSFPKYDLFFEGNYYASLVLNTTNNDIEITSTDPKEPLIEKHTGSLDNALRLSEEHLGILREELLPIIQNKIRGSLGI